MMATGTGRPVNAMTDDNLGKGDARSVESRLFALRQMHRELDRRIAELQEFGLADQLELQRLKRKKLALKDQIAQLSSDRLPDIIA